LKISTSVRGQGRERLIQSALILFGQQGIDGTTLRDVVAHAGVSLGLVRTHFGSKLGLQEATNQYVFEQLENIYTEAEGEGATSLSDLTDGRWALDSRAPEIIAYLRQVISKPEQSAELFERLYQRIYSFVERANSNGEIRPQADLKWSTFTIMSLLIGPLMMEPYAKQIIGDSLYSEPSLINRNKTYGQIFSHGLFTEKVISELD
jgi:AcrR family transcriptional regulator